MGSTSSLFVHLCYSSCTSTPQEQNHSNTFLPINLVIQTLRNKCLLQPDTQEKGCDARR